MADYVDKTMNFDDLVEYTAAVKSGAVQRRMRRRDPAHTGYTPLSHDELVAKFFPDGAAVRLAENNYPYDVSHDVDHMVCWFNPNCFDAIPANIDDVLTLVVGGGRRRDNYTWFENPSEWKSVPSIPHVHVFIQRRR